MMFPVDRDHRDGRALLGHPRDDAHHLLYVDLVVIRVNGLPVAPLAGAVVRSIVTAEIASPGRVQPARRGMVRGPRRRELSHSALRTLHGRREQVER